MMQLTHPGDGEQVPGAGAAAVGGGLQRVGRTQQGEGLKVQPGDFSGMVPVLAYCG